VAQQFFDDGYVFPVDVLDSEEALSWRDELESLEQAAKGRKLGNKNQLNYPHVIFRFAWEIVCHPGILDIVETILGPNILVWGSTFFIKEPQTDGFVSWHQDLRYLGARF
jgi:hypothetical protein